MCLGRVSSSAAGLLGNEGGGRVTLVSPELGRLAWDPTEPMLEGRRPLGGWGGDRGMCSLCSAALVHHRQLATPGEPELGRHWPGGCGRLPGGCMAVGSHYPSPLGSKGSIPVGSQSRASLTSLDTRGRAENKLGVLGPKGERVGERRRCPVVPARAWVLGPVSGLEMLGDFPVGN